MGPGWSELAIIAILALCLWKPKEAATNIRKFIEVLTEVKKNGKQVAEDLNEITQPARDVVSDLKETTDTLRNSLDITH